MNTNDYDEKRILSPTGVNYAHSVEHNKFTETYRLNIKEIIVMSDKHKWVDRDTHGPDMIITLDDPKETEEYIRTKLSQKGLI